MKKKILPFLIRLVGFTVILYLIQWAGNTYIFNETDFYYGLPAIYLFHFFATLFVFLMLVFVNSKYKHYTGFAFMGGSFFKMLAAIAFLLPMLLNGTESTFATLLSFFIPYFLYLFFETYYAVKLINSK